MVAASNRTSTFTGKQNPISWDRYSYTAGDPINANDPTGLLTLVTNGAFNDSPDFSGIRDLLRAIENGYDIVHLFSPFAPGGLLADTSDATLLGSELIEKCCERDVKLLWIANENKPDDYIKGFKAAGKPLNLIMTISRNETKFVGFLEKLLSRISSGETLPVAWTALVPQADGPWQQDLPSCIFLQGEAT